MIRLMKIDDIQQCINIVNMNYGEKYDRLEIELKAMFDNNSWIRPEYYVIEIDNKIVSFGGYCNSCIDYNCFGIYWINTHPDYKNKGYASDIVSAIINRIKLKDKKKSWIILSCKDSLKKFYGKFGFKPLMDRPIKGGCMMGVECFI